MNFMLSLIRNIYESSTTYAGSMFVSPPKKKTRENRPRLDFVKRKTELLCFCRKRLRTCRANKSITHIKCLVFSCRQMKNSFSLTEPIQTSIFQFFLCENERDYLHF